METERPRHDGLFLKIKLKHLAAESRIIRKEENKRKVWPAIPKQNIDLLRVDGASSYVLDQYKMAKLRARLERAAHRGGLDRVRELQDHRRQVVRPEARATHLAYAFVRGKTYESTENTKPLKGTADHQMVVVLSRAATMIAKYGGARGDTAGTATRLREWIDA